MILESAERIANNNATEEDIANAFNDDYGRGEFIILFKDKGTFIQAAGENEGPYVLEYREDLKLYQAVEKQTKDIVKNAFLMYLHNDLSFKNHFNWKEVLLRPWWKFW